MNLQDQLTGTIIEHVTARAQSVPDPQVVVRRGRAIRRRRKFLGWAVPAAAVAILGAVAMGTARTEQQAPGLDVPRPETFAPVGMLDYSHGLRAFASPDADGMVSIGGRSFPVRAKGYLDTDATATAFGLVFFDRAGQPHLLAQSGTDQVLAPIPTRVGRDVRLSAKADARRPLVAFTQPSAHGVSVQLASLVTRRSLDSIEVACAGSACKDVRIEAVDHGLVFVRTQGGTFVWDPKSTDAARWTLLGKGAFRVADARNGRVLWSFTPPTPASDSPVADWHFTQGAIDAQLSYDGRHILDWSPTLKPTEPGSHVIRLELKNAAWFTFDTDGSVLAATRVDRSTAAENQKSSSTIFDCGLSSGACERIGSVSTKSGDPIFIGNDM